MSNKTISLVDVRNVYYQVGEGVKVKPAEKIEKAVKLALLLLGDKAPENVIAAQARIFANLSYIDLDNSLKAFKNTVKYYKPSKKKE